jgi:uncharacterized membrane protein HdeD (DUF308 family)
MNVNCWMKSDLRYLWGLLSITAGCYLGTAALTGLLFYFFKPSSGGDCGFNVSMIVLTLLIGVILSALSISTLVSTFIHSGRCGMAQTDLLFSRGVTLCVKGQDWK